MIFVFAKGIIHFNDYLYVFILLVNLLFYSQLVLKNTAGHLI